MTDIRKHGFESDAQWREYLAEIEAAAAERGPIEPPQLTVVQELADLRRQVGELRARVHAHVQHARPRPRWWAAGAGALLLLLAVAVR